MNAKPFLSTSITAALTLALGANAHAALVRVDVTVENLAPANSVRFAPLRVGFNSGVFDAFDLGKAATAPIVSIAEGGSGSAWFPAFAAADPGATLGTAADALLPGQSDSSSFVVDTSANPYFTYASMVVPSNDFFVGNDDPKQYRLFDDTGNLLIGSITQRSRDLWDAGSEIHDPAAAAFVGMNDLRAGLATSRTVISSSCQKLGPPRSWMRSAAPSAVAKSTIARHHHAPPGRWACSFNAIAVVPIARCCTVSSM